VEWNRFLGGWTPLVPLGFQSDTAAAGAVEHHTGRIGSDPGFVENELQRSRAGVRSLVSCRWLEHRYQRRDHQYQSPFCHRADGRVAAVLPPAAALSL